MSKKEATDQLYNKRKTTSEDYFNKNKDAYYKRIAVDKQMVQFNKKLNDGVIGKVPWGTGY